MKHLLVVAILGGFALGCSQDSPTTPMALTAPVISLAPPNDATANFDAADLEDQQTRLRAILQQMGSARQLAVNEDFNCTNVEEVRVRFSEPGFIDGLNVGMFVKFIGIPAGNKTLRVWWDHATDFNEFQDVEIGDGNVNPEDATTFDVEMLIEHAYDKVGAKQVRVELILEGESGNCARNRDVFVSPDESFVTVTSFDHSATFGGVPVCSSFPGRSMGLAVDFNPPIPAGTSYTVSVRIDGPVPFPIPIAAGFSNAASTDFVFPPPVFATLPADFTATFAPTAGPHARLQIAADLFSFPPPPSMSVEVLSIDIPGKTLQIAATISGTCP